jgi:hypothetical protein
VIGNHGCNRLRLIPTTRVGQYESASKFRYAATDFDIEGLKSVLTGEVQSDFAAVSKCDLQSIDLTEYGSQIVRMFLIGCQR